MKFNPDVHKRKSIRLTNHDYSSRGLYFITIAVKDKLCLFGEIKNNVMILNGAGKMIKILWFELENNFSNIELHDFVVMPNHIHGTIEIVENVNNENNLENNSDLNDRSNLNDRVNTRFTPTGGRFEYNKESISSIVQAFKSKTTHQYIQGVYNNDRRVFNKKLWQKDFYEHIIRDDKSYNKTSEYIQHNPIKWEEDKFYYTEV